jgi:L-ascorbate metabolism protein UlaG (beta-lactamase superfamily)
MIKKLIIISCLALLGNCASWEKERKPYYFGPKSNHFDGKKFISESKGVFVNDLGSLFTIQDDWDEEPEPIKPVNLNKLEPINSARIIFIGHSTFLIQLEDINILTDPIWSNRAGPIALPLFSPKRYNPPALDFSDLPKIDYVLIGHSSYYHMDIPTIKNLKKEFDPQFITGLGNCFYLNEIKSLNLRCLELDWNDSIKSKDGTNFYFLKAKNWSKRSWFDVNKTLWGSFLIETPKIKIFFAGDTGYSRHFQEIHEKFGAIDMTLLPIGSYEPRWRMKDHHMNPEEATKAHLTLNAKKSIGMHFNTFQTTDEGYLDPEIELGEAKLKYKISKMDFVAPKFGEVFEF